MNVKFTQPHLKFLFDVASDSTKHVEGLSATRLKLAMDLTQAGLIKTIPLVHVTDAGHTVIGILVAEVNKLEIPNG